MPRGFAWLSFGGIVLLKLVLHWRRYHDEMSSHSKAASKPPTQQHDRGPSLPGVIHSCANLLNGYYLKLWCSVLWGLPRIHTALPTSRQGRLFLRRWQHAGRSSCHQWCDKHSIPQIFGRSLVGWHALKPRPLANQESLQDHLTCWHDSGATHGAAR